MAAAPGPCGRRRGRAGDGRRVAGAERRSAGPLLARRHRPHRPARAMTVGIRAVVFDLYITLTDWDAERRRPADADELAAVLGVDAAAFAAVLRATFGERVCAQMGDVRTTFAALASGL